MFKAIIQSGNAQFDVQENSTILVDVLYDEQGKALEKEAVINIDRVLMLHNLDASLNDVRAKAQASSTNACSGQDTIIGKPFIEGISIQARVLGQIKTEKVIIFKKKRRQGYMRKNGHRQPMTLIRIEKINS